MKKKAVRFSRQIRPATYEEKVNNPGPSNEYLARLAIEVHRAESSAYGICSLEYTCGPRVHLSADQLKARFPRNRWKIESTNDARYPWAVEVMECGVPFFALFTEEEMK